MTQTPRRRSVPLETLVLACMFVLLTVVTLAVVFGGAGDATLDTARKSDSPAAAILAR
jgi:hypothetical protein